MRQPFLSLNSSEFQDLLKSWGCPSFRAQQMTTWIFQQRTFALDKMLNLPKDLRARLNEHLNWDLPEITSKVESADGTTKLLLRSEAGHPMETVIMRYEERSTICVSSQVGCKLACSFCQTGKLGFIRHLTKADILGQYAQAELILQAEGRRVSHVVFMGMGEPFDNFENSVGAANTLIDPEGFGLSARHVTLSTSGIVPKIRELAGLSRAALAISLHAATDELRTDLMPINKKYPLAELKDALKEYQTKTGAKITIEYIMIRGKNCEIKHAKALVNYLHGLRCKINLIPFNAHPGMPFERPTDQEIRAFQVYLADRSFAAPVRYSRGLDISAACGQLAAKVMTNLHQQPTRKSALPIQPTL